MVQNKQHSENALLSRFKVGSVLLSPLIVKSCTVLGGTKDANARVELAFPGEAEGYRFAVEVKARGTPQSVQLAMLQARAAAQEGEWPMIQVPFLSPEKLSELEREKVSGVDLCGNGVVMVPGRLCVMRSGSPNRYPDSRPLNNPYRGRSAMVGRMLLQRPHWASLTALTVAIQTAGAELSLPQASKAVQALSEELVVTRSGGAISLSDPLLLIDKLGSEWRKPRQQVKEALRLPVGTDWARRLSSDPLLKWAVTGESSVTRYAMFSQGGPRRIAVSNLALAMTLLDGVTEPVRTFADVELVETDEPGYFFDTELDEHGIRWTSRLQTWLELQCGDARQQEAAKDVRGQMLTKAQG